MKEKTFTVDKKYTENAVLKVLNAYARKGKLTKDKEKLLDFIEESTYHGLELRFNQTDFSHPFSYRLMVMNEISYHYEKVLKKADKYKWIEFLKGELYEVYQRVIFDMTQKDV